MSWARGETADRRREQTYHKQTALKCCAKTSEIVAPPSRLVSLLSPCYYSTLTSSEHSIITQHCLLHHLQHEQCNLNSRPASIHCFDSALTVPLNTIIITCFFRIILCYSRCKSLMFTRLFITNSNITNVKVKFVWLRFAVV